MNLKSLFEELGTMSVIVSQKVMKLHGEAHNNRAFGAEESVVVQVKIKKSGLEV
jgi:hypothetical protein